jgi:hypothetical protein
MSKLLPLMTLPKRANNQTESLPRNSIVTAFLGFFCCLVLPSVTIASGQQAQDPVEVYVRTLPQKEQKSYSDLKADWDKQEKGDPKEFKQSQSQAMVMSQMILGRFCYGTIFNGMPDARTQDALRAYQAHRGLPITGTLNSITFFCLTEDDDAADKQDVGLPFFWFGWDDDYLSASGVWDRMNSSDNSLMATELECFKASSTCIEADGIDYIFSLGLSNVGSKITEFFVTKWDGYEITAEDSTPDCEHDQILINRQEKSILLISTPTYKKESCSKLLGKPETITYHLVAGFKLSQGRFQAAQEARSKLYQFSDTAKTLMQGK